MSTLKKYFTMSERIYKMNICCLLWLTLSSPGWAQSCTDSSCKIQVDFKGTYVEETCEISINGLSNNEKVQLPTLSSNLLQTDGNEVGDTPFNIALKNCPINKTVALRFVSGASVADSNTGNLINTSGDDYSKQVQVRIRNSSRAQMIIDDVGSEQDYTISSTGEDVTHSYSASYYANGSFSVTPGLIQTTANIDLIYK